MKGRLGIGSNSRRNSSAQITTIDSQDQTSLGKTGSDPVEEEKKHDVFVEEEPTPRDEEKYGTYSGDSAYFNAIDDELSAGNEIIGVKHDLLGSRPYFEGPQRGQYTFTASGRKTYITQPEPLSP